MPEGAQVTTKRISDLNPAPYNPRKALKSGDPAYEKLKKSILEFGDVGLIVWNRRTGNIVGGHQRLQVHKDLGHETVQVMEVDLPLEKEKALNLALNRISGTWDKDKLSEVLAGLVPTREDFLALGFDEKELKQALGTRAEEPGSLDKGRVQDEEAKILQKKWRTAKGQLWAIGTHRLLIGDSTEKQSYARLLDRAKAELIFTDPPYGISYEAMSGKFQKIENDDKVRAELLQFLSRAFSLMTGAAKDHASFYIWHSAATREEFVYALKAAGLVERQYIIWAKPAPTIGWGDYRWGHEPCFYCNKDGHQPQFYGDRANQTVWRVAIRDIEAVSVSMGSGLLLWEADGRELYLQPHAPKNKKVRSIKIGENQPVILQEEDTASTIWEVSREGNTFHPNQKPIELALRAINNSTLPGELVLDPFLGSGGTMVAAQKASRRCFGIEIEPMYAAVTLERMNKMGIKPRLEKSKKK